MLDAWRGGTAPVPGLTLTVICPSGVCRLITPPGGGHLCARSALSASWATIALATTAARAIRTQGVAFHIVATPKAKGLLRLVMGHGRSLRIREVRLIGQLISRLRRG